jgi:Spy/CpxP family protein refolding chaperone
MTFSELIEQFKIERANVAAQLNSLDAALAALTKIATAPAVARPASARMWTPEQKAKLSASLKRAYAAKKAGLKPSSKAKG